MNKQKIYLSYAMQFVKDEKAQWDRTVLLAKKISDMGFEVYNPYDRTEDVFEMCQVKDREEFYSLKYNDFNRYIQVMRAIKNNDINGVKSCDIIVALLDPGVSGGQAGELTIAEYAGKKVFGIMSPADRDKISSWVLACCDRVFANESELFAFLSEDTRPINIWGSQP